MYLQLVGNCWKQQSKVDHLVTVMRATYVFSSNSNRDWMTQVHFPSLITNSATMKACFCQALTRNSGNLPKNGIKTGRRVLAVSQRGGVVLCQPLPSHGALTSSGTTPAALALISIPTAAATADADHCFHCTALCFCASCNYTHKHLLHMLPCNSGQDKFSKR